MGFLRYSQLCKKCQGEPASKDSKKAGMRGGGFSGWHPSEVELWPHTCSLGTLETLCIWWGDPNSLTFLKLKANAYIIKQNVGYDDDFKIIFSNMKVHKNM